MEVEPTVLCTGVELKGCGMFMLAGCCACFLWFSVAQHGLEESSSEVAALISHATQERLRNVVEKLAVIAEHRIDLIKVRGLCEHLNI